MGPARNHCRLAGDARAAARYIPSRRRPNITESSTSKWRSISASSAACDLTKPIGSGGNEEVVLFARGPQGLVRRRAVSSARFVRLYGTHGFPASAD